LVFFGGWYASAIAPIFAASLLIAVLYRREILHVSREFRPLDCALIAVAFAVGLQLVPLPPSIVGLISPHAARVRGTLRLDAGVLENQWIPLSVDPRATLDALAVLVSAVLTFWAARGIFSSGGLRTFCRVLALVGFLISLEALIQRALFPTLIYGFWPPYTPGAQPFGPFFNRNHFAAWVMMAAPLVVGYFAARVRTRTIGSADDGSFVRVFGGASVPLMAAVGMMLVALAATFSRSALVGSVAAATTAYFLARDRVEAKRSALGPLVAATALAGMFALTSIDVEGWAERFNSTFSDTTASRVTIWRETLPMIEDFWIAGPGAGTYSMVMLLYQRTVVPLPHLGTVAHFNQAHSHYVQVAAEGGAIVALPVLIALIAFARAARDALRVDHAAAYWIRVGAACAVVSIATQSVWETALRMPANALLCATLAGIVLHRREVSTVRSAEVRSATWRA
jgi:hypothetical protein